MSSSEATKHDWADEVDLGHVPVRRVYGLGVRAFGRMGWSV